MPKNKDVERFKKIVVENHKAVARAIEQINNSLEEMEKNDKKITKLFL